MSKLKREECKSISIYKLREWGKLRSAYSSAYIFWIDYNGEETSRIDYVLDLDNNIFQLNYKIVSSGENISVDYQISRTNCHYGGERFWFICPFSASGKYCGRRVAKLYLGGGGKYFACRHCYNLAYESQSKLRYGNIGALGDFYDCDNKVRELQNKIQISHRKGRPTKKYIKLIGLYRKMNKSAINVNSLLEKIRK